jgi:hypothetical protein
MPEMPDAERQKGQMPKARNAKCSMQDCKPRHSWHSSFLAFVILGIRHSRRAFPGGTNLMLLDN